MRSPVQAIEHRLVRPAQEFLARETAGGFAILAAAVVAFVWANSPWSEQYFDLWHSKVTLETGLLTLDEDLGHLVNDGLMAIFFFMIGLETKRELLHGELAGFRKAALPVSAAIGGLVLPALIFTAFNAGGDGARGWGIPMATDIAFAVAVLALLGRRAPFPLKVFLLALAVADDLGAIAVIAVFYSDGISVEALMYAGLVLAVILVVRQFGVRRLDVYTLLGALFWVAVLESGIHATIAGVLLAFLTPSRPKQDVEKFRAEADLFLDAFDKNRGDSDAQQVVLHEFEAAVRRSEAPLERLEHLIHPWVVFAIVPIFALANAGVEVTSEAFEGAIQSRVTYGVMLGLVLGKPIGIFLATWIAVRSGLAALPNGVSYAHILGVGMIAGLGFTVSLFVTDLAFDDALLIDEAKLGILAGSIIAGVAGLVFLRLAVKPGEDFAPPPIVSH
ncbi:MAG: Na+/H+ antiporter NhaA [Dehalococcoidia bacterium]|nr:Na+/H+ antiporter NhaA [Dehalococcoidia bacterium]MCB9486356.1 Na+/H+ antiporter NhaA [Thermoflexaceae bacterium]